MTFPSKELYLLRHGNTFDKGQTCVQVGIKTDLPLVVKGIEQAQSFANFLKNNDLTPATIYCGSLQRHRQTANEINKVFPDSHIIANIQALNELDYGDWEGLTPEEIQNKWPEEDKLWQQSGKWPSAIFGHDQNFHIELLTIWFNTIFDVTSSSPIIAVTSGGVIKLISQMLADGLTTDNPELFLNKKVKTGHYCTLELHSGQKVTVKDWNQST